MGRAAQTRVYSCNIRFPQQRIETWTGVSNEEYLGKTQITRLQLYLFNRKEKIGQMLFALELEVPFTTKLRSSASNS